METPIIDQQQLKQERIERNIKLYELGQLALSRDQRAEIDEFRRIARQVIIEAEQATVQAAEQQLVS